VNITNKQLPKVVLFRGYRQFLFVITKININNVEYYSQINIQ